MFHGVIQKIKLAQFFLRHGVVRIICGTCGQPAALWVTLEYSAVSEAWQEHRYQMRRQAEVKTQLVYLTNHPAEPHHYSPTHSPCQAPVTYAQLTTNREYDDINLSDDHTTFTVTIVSSMSVKHLQSCNSNILYSTSSWSVCTKGVARLQFNRKQSGQVKRQMHVSQDPQDAERGGVWGRVSSFCQGGVWGRG